MYDKRLTDTACKNIIKSLARKLGVEPKLVTTRLMSEEDKNDMRDGNLPIDSLKCHIQAWKKSGMPNYRERKTEPLVQEKLREERDKLSS